MKKCPFCKEQIQDDAVKCRYCGEFLDARASVSSAMRASGPYIAAGFYGFEYKSKLSILGWPLIHIANGINPATGAPRIARGIIAIGNIAVGLLAIGGASFGGVCLGGFSLGVLALGGAAVGWAAVGGAAVAIHFAVGGLAVSAAYAIGGLAIAPHTLGATGADPELLKMIEKWVPGISKAFGQR